ncbi:MAG: type III PLP-dependent enzyme [Chloroflexota bacterium]|nr:type III PLP-dependent enzyme [Chloroflexota bacterium]
MLTPIKASTEQILQQIARADKTPALIIDKEAVRQKYCEFRDKFKGAKIYYALKANPHPDIVKLLKECGCAFEISSQGELELLLESEIPPREIVSGNPVKDHAFIKFACDNGIELFAFDSYAELEKLSQFAPGCKVCVRLSVSNEGSEWPLSRKFGVEMEEAAHLLLHAEERGLVPYGISFHVGSQCTEPGSWVRAIEKSRQVWDAAAKEGLKLHLLNIGGGFPVKYIKPVPSIGEIARLVMSSVAETFPGDIELIVTPGRALVGEAGTMVAAVIAKAGRNEKKWLYLNVGVFNGLMETVGGIKYSFVSARHKLTYRENNDGATKWTLAGPSCDSFDVIATEVELPEVNIGDIIYITSAGAYTTSYASHFDGFPIPRTYLVD